MGETGEEIVKGTMQAKIDGDQLGPGSLGDDHVERITESEVRPQSPSALQ